MSPRIRVECDPQRYEDKLMATNDFFRAIERFNRVYEEAHMKFRAKLSPEEESDLSDLEQTVSAAADKADR